MACGRIKLATAIREEVDRLAASSLLCMRSKPHERKLTMPKQGPPKELSSYGGPARSTRAVWIAGGACVMRAVASTMAMEWPDAPSGKNGEATVSFVHFRGIEGQVHYLLPHRVGDAVPHPVWPWATIFQSLRAT